MKEDRLILVLGGKQYAAPFREHGKITYDINDVLKCDAVVFTGGEDVSPLLYEDPDEDGNVYIHHKTHSNFTRDLQELGIGLIADNLGIPVFGICRGSQFLCVAAGGRLVQDIDGHGIMGTHEIISAEGKSIQVTSTHHQAMMPHNLLPSEYKVIAEAPNVEGTDEFVAVEAVIFKWIRALAVQFHPEYMSIHSEGWKYYQELVTTHFDTYG